MKRNADKDLIEFSTESKFENEKNIDDKVKEIGKITGITCDKCDTYRYKISDVIIGSSLCLHCKYCYGAKLRYHTDGNCSKVDGYIKCSKNNKSFLNKLNHLIWKIKGCRPIIKNLNNI